MIGKLIPAGTGTHGHRPQNDIVAAKAKELRQKRLERTHQVDTDSEFNKIVNETNQVVQETSEEVESDSIIIE